jgi:hypothetical protein
VPTPEITIRAVSRTDDTPVEDFYRYDVIWKGDVLIRRSRDPETDAARALYARGVTGKIAVRDAVTGKIRTIVDVGKARLLRTVDRPDRGLSFGKFKEWPRSNPPPFGGGARKGGRKAPSR